MVQLKLAGKLNTSIKLDSLVDGEGLRVVLFTSYCPHRCVGCHNPQTWDAKNGVDYSIDELVAYLIPLLTSGNYDGLTLSGGDPLAQSGAIYELLRALKVKIPNLNVWCYTGYLIENLPNPSILPWIDVLVDGPFERGNMFPRLPFRGSRNQRLIRLNHGEIVSID